MEPKPLASEIGETLKNRRSYRDFATQPVEAAEIAEVLEQVATAPSAWNLQPWRFVVITDPETKEALQGAAFGQKQVTGAPVVVALYTDMVEALARVDDVLHPSMPADVKEGYKQRVLGSFARMTPEERDQWGKAQGYIALGYLILLLELHGYVSSPMLGFDPPAVRKILGLPDHAEIPALIAIGHRSADHPGPQHRLPIDQMLRYVE
jgi:nitroreductase